MSATIATLQRFSEKSLRARAYGEVYRKVVESLQTLQIGFEMMTEQMNVEDKTVYKSEPVQEPALDNSNSDVRYL